MNELMTALVVVGIIGAGVLLLVVWGLCKTSADCQEWEDARRRDRE